MFAFKFIFYWISWNEICSFLNWNFSKLNFIELLSIKLENSGIFTKNIFIAVYSKYRRQFEWIQLNWIGSDRIEFEFEFHWIQFKLICSILIDLNQLKAKLIDLNWMALNSIELHWYERNCIELNLNSTELNLN